jgi:S-adenosylhomocysteine hydrolase
MVVKNLQLMLFVVQLILCLLVKELLFGYGDVGKGTASLEVLDLSLQLLKLTQFVLYKLQWTVLKLKKLNTVVGNADIIITTTGNKDIVLGSHFEQKKIKLSFVTSDTLITKLHGLVKH